MQLEPAAGFIYIRQHHAEEAPEVRTVRPVPQVGQFTDHDVLEHLGWREDQVLVDDHIAPGPTRAPAVDKNGRRD